MDKIAKSEKELVDRLIEIDRRMSSWNNQGWADLFNKFATELTAKRQVYAPGDKEELLLNIISGLLSKGSQASPAETSLVRMLTGPQGGMSLASRYVDALVDKVNAQVQLNVMRTEQPMEKVARSQPSWRPFAGGLAGAFEAWKSLLSETTSRNAAIKETFLILDKTIKLLNHFAPMRPSLALPRSEADLIYLCKVAANWSLAGATLDLPKEETQLLDRLLDHIVALSVDGPASFGSRDKREKSEEMDSIATEMDRLLDELAALEGKTSKGDDAAKRVEVIKARLRALQEEKNSLESVHKAAATYDSWETDNLFTKQLAERDDYGGHPYPHDYPENSSDVRPWSLPRHQQELWNRFKEWWQKKWVGREVDEMPKSENQGLGGPYVAWKGSPAEVNAMPAMKEGELKKEAIDEYANHHVSFTFEFMQDELKVSATWDKQDMPPGLNEEQTLIRIVNFLEKKLPEAFNKFKHARIQDVDLANRMVGIVVPIGARHGRQPSRHI